MTWRTPAGGRPTTGWCAGPRWAERTTTVRGSGRDLMRARAVWVAVARPDGRPVPLGAAFHRLYGDAAQGRTVSARLAHPGPPPTDGLPASQAGRAWPLRASDFDLAGHVTNSVHWAAVDLNTPLENVVLPAAGKTMPLRPILVMVGVAVVLSETGRRGTYHTSGE